MADDINFSARSPAARERGIARSSGKRSSDRANPILGSIGLVSLPGEIIPKGPLEQVAVALLVLAGLLYVYFDALAGIIRWVFPAMGLTLLTYLPAEVAVIALVCDMSSRLRSRDTALPLIALLGILLADMILSKIVGREPLAITFEVYIGLPALVMVSLTRRRMQDRIINAMAIVFFVATIGVLINIFVAFPWANATFEVMGQTKGVAREWQAHGMSRLAGFSRASYNASAHILIGFCALEHRLSSLLYKGLFWAIGLVAMYFTTSKSPELAMLLLPGMYFLIGQIRQTKGARRTWTANAMMGLWLVLVFAGPLVAATFGPRLYPLGVGIGRSYDSLADRVLNTWPHAIDLFDWKNPVEWLIGRGLGGIGIAQNLVEPDHYNSADNLAIYLFITFGLASLSFIYLIFRGGQRAINAGARGRRDFAMIIAMLGIGTAANVVESTIPAMVLGLACARTRSMRAKRDE